MRGDKWANDPASAFHLEIGVEGFVDLLKQRGLAGRRKGDGGAELGFPSNGLYREGAVLSKKVHQMAPNVSFNIVGAFKKAILRTQSAIQGGYLPIYHTRLIIRVKLSLSTPPL